MLYEPRTTALQRADLLTAVKQEANGAGIGVLRDILRDLDDAEAQISKKPARSPTTIGESPRALSAQNTQAMCLRRVRSR